MMTYDLKVALILAVTHKKKHHRALKYNIYSDSGKPLNKTKI